MIEEVKPIWIAGFWKRLFALIIDTLFLALLGFLLGLMLEPVFLQLGGWGRLVGFGIALSYFGVMNSRLCGGQTFGKRLLEIEVVDRNGHEIPLTKSLLRYVVFGVPFFINGAQFSNEVLLSFLMYPISMVFFGGTFSIVYLYVFNRVTRQSLHDIAAGTLVVKVGVEKQTVGKVWKPHLILVSVLFFLAAIVPVFTGKLLKSEPFKNLVTAQSSLLNETDVIHAEVTSGVSTFTSTTTGTTKTAYVAAEITLSSDRVDDVELAQEFAEIIIDNYPVALNKDVLVVTLTYGYDIGIYSRRSNYQHSFDLSEFAIRD